MQSKTLSAYIVNYLPSDGEGMVFNLITQDERENFYKKWTKPFNKITFRANHGGFTSPVLTLSLPKDIEQINEIKLEIDRIYKKHMDSKDVKDCMSTRKNLETHRKNLLTQISKLNIDL